MVQTASNPGLVVAIIIVTAIIVPVLRSELQARWKAAMTIPAVSLVPFLMVALNWALWWAFGWQ